MIFYYIIYLIFRSSSLAATTRSNPNNSNVEEESTLFNHKNEPVRHKIENQKELDFLINIFDELRKLFKREMINENNQNKITDFLQSLSEELIKEIKSQCETANDNKNLNELQQKVLDELISELRIKYNSELKHEYKEQENSFKTNTIQNGWLEIESKFRKSNKHDRKVIFSTLIDIYSEEKLNYANANINEFKEIFYLRLKVYKTIQRIISKDLTDPSDKEFEEMIATIQENFSIYKEETELMNEEKKEKVLKKYEEIQKMPLYKKLFKIKNNIQFDEKFLENILPILKRIFHETIDYIAETERIQIFDIMTKRLSYDLVLQAKTRLEFLMYVNYDIEKFKKILNAIKDSRFLSNLFKKND